MKITMRAIVPRRRLSVEKYNDAIQRANARIAQDALASLQAVTATWSQPVQFIIQAIQDGITITTHDQRFIWTNYGTRPHPISTTPPKRMFFWAGSKPKTYPGSVLSTSGEPGSIPVRTRHIDHPGTEPRLFTTIIVEQLRPMYRAYLQMEINAATRSS